MKECVACLKGPWFSFKRTKVLIHEDQGAPMRGLGFSFEKTGFSVKSTGVLNQQNGVHN